MKKIYAYSFVIGVLGILFFSSRAGSFVFYPVSVHLNTVVDTIARNTADFSARFLSVFEKTNFAENAIKLEAENRKLSSEVSRLSVQLSDLQVIASSSAVLRLRSNVVPVRISKDSQGWFAPYNPTQPIDVGAAVLAQDAYVGRVSAVSNKTISIELFSDSAFSVSLLHQKTKKLGSLHNENGKLVVEFFEVVSDLESGDLFVTNGQRERTESGFFAGKVGKILTQPADAVTRVEFIPALYVSSGQLVFIESNTP